MAAATDANSSTSPELHIIQAQGPLQRLEHSGHLTNSYGVFTNIKQFDWFQGMSEIQYMTSLMRKIPQVKSILSSFSMTQQQSDLCPHHQRKSLYHLKCCSRWCIQFGGHSSLRWWMKRKVEEDMVNVAPNLCVLFYFISPQLSRDESVHSLWLRFEVTEALNRYQQSSCALAAFWD